MSESMSQSHNQTQTQTVTGLPSKTWIFPDKTAPDPALVEACGGSTLLAGVLMRRGFSTVETVNQFLDESLYVATPPNELPNIDKAIVRICEAISTGEHITVYGDYDVDGITGTSVLLTVLKQLGANVDFYIPNRSTEGYGLNLKAVSVLASKHRTKLIITCDCGVSNFAEINLAKSLGVDTLVLDHHTMPEMLPPAVAVVHPKLLAEDHPLFHLPGVGVAYKVCEALLTRFSKEDEIEKLHDFVTLGMIADLVPLVLENRYLVRVGLPRLVASKRPGIKALLVQVAGKEDTDLVGFGLAPRLNAVGRLSDAKFAVELLTTDDPARADELAQQMQRENARRQELCEKIYMEAEHMVLTKCDLNQDKGIAIYAEGWHHGVVGIVASRLVEKFQRPVFIGELDREEGMVRGSARGVDQIDLYEVLKANEHLLTKWGGHKMAAGFAIEAEKAESAARGIVATCNRMMNGKALSTRLQIDAIADGATLSLDTAKDLNRMAPFGMGNKKPILCLEQCRVTSTRTLGKEGKHSRVNLLDPASGREFEAVLWSSRGRVPADDEQVDVVFNPDINSYQGRDRLQLVLIDWRRHGVKEMLQSDEQLTSASSGGQQAKQNFAPGAGSGKAAAGSGDASGDNGKGKADGSPDMRPAAVTESITGESPAAIKFMFKDLRSFQGNAEVVKKAQAKLGKDLIIFGESCPRVDGIEFTDRTLITEKDHLLLWQFPPTLKNLQDLMRSSRATNLYVVGCEDDELEEPAFFLKRLLGLVRFAINQREGQVEGEKLAALLGASKMSVALALTALKKVHWIDWFSENGMLYLDILGQPMESVEDTPEYKQMAASLDQVKKFRQWCRECSMKEIQLALVPNRVELAATPVELGDEVPGRPGVLKSVTTYGE
ncbi:MAG: single-stranded-DNA-specific exonuclease RecJ [Cyanobacteria bacterium SZAS LIN-3]|nr:single-stranded-DNA-specific exonuclease RecJ [Cyanobacteria bacterium SZAS LIN-3]